MRPNYYNPTGALEVIDVIQAYDMNFALGNVLKYVVRAGIKTEDPIVDMQKVKTYLEFELRVGRKTRDQMPRACNIPRALGLAGESAAICDAVLAAAQGNRFLLDRLPT